MGGRADSTLQRPWMVAVASRPQFGDARSGQFCGGTLVTPTKVVTAAHCFYDESQGRIIDRPELRVIVGRTDLAYQEGAEVPVTNVWVHPQYSFQQNMQDVAVLTLATPQDGRAVLPMVGQGETLPYAAGTRAQVYGWGDTTGHARYAGSLRSVDVPMVADAVCARDYPGVRMGPSIRAAWSVLTRPEVAKTPVRATAAARWWSTAGWSAWSPGEPVARRRATRACTPGCRLSRTRSTPSCEWVPSCDEGCG